MAYSQSIRKGHIPVSCGLCETDRPIKWKCLDCDLLLCNHCKEKTCDTLVCPTCVAKVHKKHDLTEIHEGYDMKIDKLKKGQSKIQLDRKEIVSKKEQLNQLLSSENSKYNQISSGNSCLVQKVKPDGTKLKILSRYNAKVYGMAVTHSNNLLRLQEISSKTGALSDTVYDMSPLEPSAIYITSNNKVLVGGVNKDFPNQGRRVVILMNQNGDHERVENEHKPIKIFESGETLSEIRKINTEEISTSLEAVHKKKKTLATLDKQIHNTVNSKDITDEILETDEY
ncbi:unnamed protein product [Mytilus coruscus]|uniref:B box-type domain-containing protein n=1 Tax=Mytilus coruscus TaxID=42192 RepID=A0A6J8EZ86_MYTCO|nr:unnamed protein product [Mytilus coruscus]